MRDVLDSLVFLEMLGEVNGTFFARPSEFRDEAAYGAHLRSSKTAKDGALISNEDEH